MLGPFTFTFTFESEEFKKSEKVVAGMYRVSLKKRSFTRLAPKPLHKALLVLKMVHNDEDQSKTL